MPHSWIVRDQQVDYGIDLEIEIADTTVTGVICKAQVKAHHRLNWTNRDTYYQRVKGETWEYWQALPVPVILIVVDVSERACFWVSGNGPGPLGESVPSGLHVHRSCSLPATQDELAQEIREWVDRRSFRDLVYSFPFLQSQLRDLERSLNRDLHLPVEEELLSLQRLYGDTIALSRAVGLSDEPLLPWELWLARSQCAYGNSEILHFGVYDEVLHYLRRLLERLQTKCCELVQGDPITFDSVPLRSICDGIEYQLIPSLTHRSVAFWRTLEQYLGRIGALRALVPSPKQHSDG